MKIALVSPYDWGYPGGVKTHIEHLATELRHRGHSVRILTPSSQRGDRPMEFGIYKIGWTAPVRLNGSIARVAITPALTGSLRRLLRFEQFDIIHLHEPMVSTLTLAVLRLARAMHIPCVATFHASTNKRTSTAAVAYAMASPFLQASFRRIDGYIAVSSAALAHVSWHFTANYHIIPNGIDIGHFAPTVTPLPQFADGACNILFLSRLEPRKGLRYFLKAIPLIREQYATMGGPPLRFIIAGDGPQRMKFQRFAQQMGWQDVVFVGYVPEEEKPSYFASATIYCAPATGSESQGLILLEAMATGTPVVASDIPGYRTVIPTAAEGLLTPPRDAERLAWAVCHLLRQPELRARIGEQGRQRAQLYSWPRITEEIEAVYEESQVRSLERQQEVYHLPRGMRIPSPRRLFHRQLVTFGQPDPSGWHISPQGKNVVE